MGKKENTLRLRKYILDKTDTEFDPKDSEEPITVEGDLDLTNVTVEKPLKFKNYTFKGKIKAIYSTFKESVEFEECTFEQEVNFGDCEQAHTVFEKSVNFKECTFERKFHFVGVIVKGMADFEGSTFEKEVNFLCAKFERALFLCNTKLHDEADFKSMNITSYAKFDKMKCLGEQKNIDFTGSSFGDKVTFEEICCKSKLLLIAVKVNFFNFKEAKLHNTFDVRYISCNEFFCEGVEFRGKVDFDSTHIKLTLNLNGSKIYDDFSLKSVVVHQVHFNIDVKSDGRLDLRGFKFEVMKDSGSKCDMERFLKLFNEKQNDEKFTRDPYIELECFYRTRGRIKFADEVHYEGKSQLRKYAFKKASTINMSRTERWLDGIVKVLTGYGTKNKRLLFILLGVIAFGAV
ncbi:MAG: pentapeptide repeat-containing protein, partial [Bacteroidales bacterium]|nr:pentapeptide repeat-containing protein [Bacteroidales bacterium]